MDTDSDEDFWTNAVDSEEENEYLRQAADDYQRRREESEEEDEILRNVPYVPPAPQVPHLDHDDQLLMIPGKDVDELPDPDYVAPPSPQQPGEKPRSNYDYIDYQDDANNMMYNAATDQNLNDEDMPFNYDEPWDSFDRITNLVDEVLVDNAMEGAVQNITVLFKDRHSNDDVINRDRLDAVLNDIAYISGYLAGYYVNKRKAYLTENGWDAHRYYKIRVTTRAYFMKPTAADEGQDTYKVFDNERIINRFDTKGVPWGLTTPVQAYKMCAGACRRAISDTRTSQSGFSYQKMHSINIAIYECKGVQAAGEDDDFMFNVSDFENDNEIMQDEEYLQDPEEIIEKVMQEHEKMQAEEEIDEDSQNEENSTDEDEDLAVPVTTYRRKGQKQSTKKKKSKKVKKVRPLYDKRGVLTKIADAKALICPKTDHGCFYDCIKLAMIYNFNTPDYVKQLKNMQRRTNIDDEFAKLYGRDLPHLLIPEGSPEDVPLDDRFFEKFLEVNHWIFLHIWIQVEGVGLPIQLFYRSQPFENTLPVHLLFVGPKAGKYVGHFYFVKKINALFYHTEKSNNTTKFYCPWCCGYKVRTPCTKHKRIDGNKALFCGKCMAFFNTQKEYDYHQDKCLIKDNNVRPVIIPQEPKRVEFNIKHTNRTYLLPVIFVADFESTLYKVQANDPKRHKQGTKMWRDRRHLPTSFGIKMATRPDILKYEESLPEEERFPEDLDDFYICSGSSPDAVMNDFCNILLDWSERIQRYFKYRGKHTRKLTDEEQEKFRHEECCYMCRRSFQKFRACDKKQDIDYFTSKYLGAACPECYMARKPEHHFIPLFFHNAKGYDMHFVLKAITHDCYGCQFEGIPMNGEKLMSMTISREEKRKTLDGHEYKVKTMCDIRILDSILFLLLGLGPLNEILKSQHKDNLEEGFPITYRTFRKQKYADPIEQKQNALQGNARFGYNNEQIEIALQKNLYPYLWFDDPMKLALPIGELDKLVAEDRYEMFTDTVTEKFKQNFAKQKARYFEIRAKFPDIKEVWEWVDIYLTNDVCNLADIMMMFRFTLHASHGLDAAYYFGGPSMSWDAFLLKLTREHPEWCPELICQDMNMLCFFKKCIRGGTSCVMKRYSKAYNKFMPKIYKPEAEIVSEEMESGPMENEEEQPKKPKKKTYYIIDLDANNLYGWGMKGKLPMGDFKWMDDVFLEYLNEHLCKDGLMHWIEMIEKDDRGAFIECDLYVPEHLHDRFNSYPPAPEKLKVKKEDISPFVNEMNRTSNSKPNTTTPMLMQTLAKKDHYYVHIKNLGLYLKLGLVVEKIYNVVTFAQAKFMEAYIDMNTFLRVNGRSAFEKLLYKLMNNSIYGKTFEDPGKRAALKFINGVDQYYKIVSKTGFNGSVFQQDDFMIAKVLYESITYEKPLYLGATITEYAKYLMFDFYYNVLLDYYDETRVKLLFTDTDSLMLEIQTEDIFADIKEINDKYDCPIDVSSFAKEVVEKYQISTAGNGVIGKFKSETGSDVIYQFAGLRSKMYAFELYKDHFNEEKSDEDKCSKKAKGVPKASLATLSMNAYLDCLFGTHDEKIIDEIAEKHLPIHLGDATKIRQEIQIKGIRSFAHEIYSYNCVKYGLSCNDTKRFILWDNINTLAFGHKDIPKIKLEQLEEYKEPIEPPKKKRRKAAITAN